MAALQKVLHDDPEKTPIFSPYVDLLSEGTEPLA
jgi:hypothetical protein